MAINWVAVSALTSVVYGVAFIGSIYLVLLQLRRQADEQFVSGTSSAFEIWMADDFQQAVQWVLYELQADSWRAFKEQHRGGYGERALIRVGSFYNRIGYLATRRLLGRNDRILLDSVAGNAIAVWRKIEPLVLEARLIENSTLFQDFEAMLPTCYECYVPAPPRRDAATALAEE